MWLYNKHKSEKGKPRGCLDSMLGELKASYLPDKDLAQDFTELGFCLSLSGLDGSEALVEIVFRY